MPILERTEPAPIPIDGRILLVRGRQVMLDEDLADLYDVATRRLVEQVKRNLDRFPEDFMFRLTQDEWFRLDPRKNRRHGGRRSAPYAFTEQGVAMLSGVLRSKRAVTVNIEIMRAFVELRRAASAHAELDSRLADLEVETAERLGAHDEQISNIFEVIRKLIAPPPRPKRKVGFQLPESDG